MDDLDQFRRSAIKYWERRRIFYNLALVPPAFLGFVLQGSTGDPTLGPGEILALFLFSAVAANVCYSFAYALELWFGSSDPKSLWVEAGRLFVFLFGTMFAMGLAALGGQEIALLAYHTT